MPKYSVLVEGENFPMKLNGSDIRLFGFIATRKVKTKNPKDAEQVALHLVRSDEELKTSIEEIQSDEPKIYIQEVLKLNWWSRLGGEGYSFFPMNEKDIES